MIFGTGFSLEFQEPLTCQADSSLLALATSFLYTTLERCFFPSSPILSYSRFIIYYTV